MEAVDARKEVADFTFVLDERVDQTSVGRVTTNRRVHGSPFSDPLKDVHGGVCASLARKYDLATTRLGSTGLNNLLPRHDEPELMAMCRAIVVLTRRRQRHIDREGVE